MRLGPNRFSFDDPADVKTIYALNSGFTKTDYYIGLADPRRANIFTTRDEKDHANRKRTVAGLYTMSTMVHYEPAVDKMTAVYVSKFENFARQRTLIPLGTFMQYYAFDVIAQITFNQNFGMMQREEDYHHLVEDLHRLLNAGAMLGVVPKVLPWFVRCGELLRLRNPGAAITDFTFANIAAARVETRDFDSISKAEPFVYKALQLESQGKLGLSGLIDSCNSNIGAGSDTTGITLTAIMYYLHQHKDTLRKLQQEIDLAAKEGRISDPVTFSEAQSLPYLQAVIKEALRLHPAVGAILPRRVPSGGAYLAGHFFPEGAEVGTSAYALHRNKRYHGEDCTQWRPERWLSPLDTDRKSAMSFSFGAGSRVCLGKNISLLEINKLVPQIVRKFEIEFERDMSGSIIDAQSHTAWFVWLLFNCQVVQRDVAREKT